ncbi:putative Vicilin-like seed storage protein [Cocos nucifera]|nr:putative Vicilin-like seed storage protein [Cocos nucifera]
MASTLLATIYLWSLVAINGKDFPSFGPLVTRESRRTLVTTDSGMITAVDVHDGYKGLYHLQFITMEPSSLFLPVLLHTDILFYVQTGTGTVSYTAEDGTTRVDVKHGDIYRLEEGTIFYVRSHPDPMREKLRINAIFDTNNMENPSESFVGAYSNISDLIRGFDDKVLEMSFAVSEEIIHSIEWVKPPSIIPFTPKKNESRKHNWKEGIFEALVGFQSPTDIVNKKKKMTKTKTFNIYSASPDVENYNGWSIAVTKKEFRSLRGSQFGVFMVNLTKGSMMGPHWNPTAMEIAVVIEGQGMVQVVCPSKPSGEGGETFRCQNTKFRVKEGDLFVVPRYHPMVQISFNNNSFVFVGFSTMVKKNYPQFLVGERSVLQTIEREILEVSFNSSNTTIETLLTSQRESIMLACTSCAEELERKVEEIERQKREEARREEEEEAKKREKEEARKRKEEEARREEEEGEARRREEEEARKMQEKEARREEEEARRREEEEARKREEEEAKRREEEEEARRRQKEEAVRREEEEAKKRKEGEEEEAKKRKEREKEEAKKKEEAPTRRREEEEEARRRQEKEAAPRKREEEEARKREEEEAKRREEEEARKEEEENERREEHEEAGKREKEVKKRKEEEARRREEEEARKEEEEAERREKEEVREKEEKEAKRRIKEEARRKEKMRKREEEEAEKREEEVRRREKEEAKRREGEEARKREKKRARKKDVEEEARKREEEGGGKEEEPSNRKRRGGKEGRKGGEEQG